MDTLSKISIFNKTENFCAQEELILPGQTLIVGLSGGPDSVFLLTFLHYLQKKYNLRLVAAHLDHGWRSNSADDALFCKQLCEKLSITYEQQILVNSQTKDVSTSGSLEQDGRKARRIFFEACAQRHQADRIALAHHLDDKAETFFIRLIRGAGLAGLASIRARHGLYIRPLLSLTKKEILDYLQAEKISFCADSTNLDVRFLRNNIRHTLMQVYSSLDRRAGKHIIRAIDQLQQADAFIDHYAQTAFDAMLDNGLLDIQKFLACQKIIQHRVLVHWLIKHQVKFVPTEPFFNEIVRFFKNTGSPAHRIAADWTIKKTKNHVQIIHHA